LKCKRISYIAFPVKWMKISFNFWEFQTKVWDQYQLNKTDPWTLSIRENVIMRKKQGLRLCIVDLHYQCGVACYLNTASTFLAKFCRTKKAHVVHGSHSWTMVKRIFDIRSFLVSAKILCTLARWSTAIKSMSPRVGQCRHQRL